MFTGSNQPLLPWATRAGIKHYGPERECLESTGFTGMSVGTSIFHGNDKCKATATKA